MASAPETFTTGDYKLVPVPVDLRRHFNRDVVADPGDDSNDTVDIDDCSFLKEGFDGTPTPNPKVRGLPRDRVVGIHEIAPYGGPNALQTTPQDREDIRVEVPPAQYAALRFLVTGGHGDTTMPVALEYADGESQKCAITCDDWASEHEPSIFPPRDIAPGADRVLGGLDVLEDGAWRNLGNRGLFEVTVAADPSRTLTAFRLEPAGATFYRFAEQQTRFNLFAVAAVRLLE